MFDENKDGRDLIVSFANSLLNSQIVRLLRTPKHWAYYIFENIRRACSMT
jgi:hypothetical protein